MSILSEIRESYRDNGVVIKLIYINTAIFLAVRLISLIWRDFVPAVLAIPTNWGGALTHPWTFFTYMFTHMDLIHVLFNMFALYWFGRIFNQVAGNHLVMRIYLLGGLTGAVVCLLASGIMDVGGWMIGASAAIMALLGTVAALAPNYVVHITFVGDVRLKFYALIFLLIDLVGLTGFSNIGGHLSHIGGVVAGALIGHYWRTHSLPQPKESWIKINWNTDRKRAKMKVQRSSRPMTDDEYNAHRAEHTREVDRILDKIKATGYDSLTKEEKQTLFDASKQ